MEKEIKKRNGCISFWLWIAIIANVCMAIFYAVTMFSAYSGEAALGLGLCSIFGVVNILSAILLFRWNKIGFYMMVVSSLLAVVVNICVLKIEPIAMVSSLFAVVIWWAILQIKKDGVSAWSQLQSGWDGKHCRHLYQLFAGIGLILFILTLIAFAQEHNNPFETVIPADDDIVTIIEEEVLDSVEVDSVVAIEEDMETPAIPVRTQKEKSLPKHEKQELDDYNEKTPSKQASTEDEVVEKSLRFLKQAIADGNKEFPQKAAEGMIMKRIYLDGDYVMYLAECDEDLYDIDLLELNKSEVKKNIKKTASSNEDPMISYFVKLCIKAHKGIGFKYQGDTTHKSCVVRITYSELKNL